MFGLLVPDTLDCHETVSRFRNVGLKLDMDEALEPTIFSGRDSNKVCSRRHVSFPTLQEQSMAWYSDKVV